ncbi:MAG: ACP S-malonyltransferase [Clostridia bacterium]
MKIGYLFPGQGAQSVEMGKDLYEEYEIVRNIYNKVKKITGIDIAKLSFEGPEETLNETKNTQLAILTNSLAILEILKQNNIKPEISAGLSLGEYTALINANVISFDEGVKLVQKRGEYMQNLLPNGDWQMAAIIGMSEEQVNEICKKVKSGFVVPANYNCVGQIAISGEKKAVLEAQQIANKMGAKKVIILKTAGPFHTQKLLNSSNALRRELENITINKFNSKVIKNIDGEFYKDTDNIKDILAKHIISPVRFSRTIENMISNGIDTFVEIGPGKTLSGFVKRMPTEKQLKIFNINNVVNLKETIKYIKEEGINE